METAVFYLDLDINSAVSAACVSLRQGESGRKIAVRLNQGEKPYPVDEECTAVFSGTLPDGQTFFNACDVEDGKAICDISARITSVPGLVRAEIRLYGNDDVLIASPSFSIDVIECAMAEGDIVSGPEATALTSLISHAYEAIEDCKASVVNKVEVRLLEGQGEASAFVELDKREDDRIMRFSFSNLKGSKGDPGPQGEQGIQGPKGDTGKGLDIVGRVDTAEQLPVTAEQSEFWNVGYEPPYNVFMFNNGAWENQGQLHGEKGDKGERGITFIPNLNTAGELFWTNDGGLVNPEPVNIKGPQGEQGTKGDKGDKGDPGPQGERGIQGPVGADGANGVVFTPKIDSDGNLSWTNDGGLTNPEPVNITGPQGTQGEKGETGIGIPPYGGVGQVLGKLSDADYDVGWGQVGSAGIELGAVTLERINSSAYDTAPTPGSSKLVTSGGVEEALSGKISMTKLWENASPTSEFAAQTILQNVSSEFEFIRVFFSFSREPSFEIMRDTSRVCNNINNGDSTATMSVSTRKINFTDGVVSAEDAKYKTFPAGTPTVSNTLMVPRIIYGIKGVIE